MRNSVTNFQLVIKAYLDELSQIDEQFAVKYQSAEKSIEECCAYNLGDEEISAERRYGSNRR